MNEIRSDRNELEYDYRETRPHILVLEEGHSLFSERLTRDLGLGFRLLSFAEPNHLMSMLNALHARRLPILAIIIYQTLSTESFLQFLSFFNEIPHARKATIYYYNYHVLYAFHDGRRILAQPLFLVDDVEIQAGIILETLGSPKSAIA